ncbi:histidine kinase [Bacillus gobiensis]|uniref:histidine kinase n=1 Tax=Bacillus gobiensis TaxID=1441095 RepID=UPI003D231E25
MRVNLNKVAYIAIFLSIAYMIYMITVHINPIQTGMKVTETNEGYLKVIHIEPRSLAAALDVKIGDIITEVNEEHPNGKLSTVDENLQSFMIKRGNENIHFQLGYSLISSENLFMLVIPFLFYFLSLYCIYFILKSNKNLNLPSAFILILFLLVTSVSYMGGVATARGDIFSKSLTYLTFLEVPVLYFHFIYQYFKETGKKFFDSKILFLLYPIGLIVSLIDYFREFFHISYNLSKDIILISFLVIFIISFSFILYGLIKYKFSEQAYLLRILFLNNCLALTPFILLYVLPLVFYGDFIFSALYLVPFLLLIPFSLVYQFVARKIYNIEFLLGRFKYYGFLSILPTILLAIVFTFLSGEASTGFTTIKYIVFTYLIMLAVFYLKEILDFRFRLKRFSEKFNYQDSIYKFTQLIRSATSLNQVLTELKNTILDVLIVSKALVLEVKTDGSIKRLSKVNDKKQEWEPYTAEIINVTEGIGKIVEIDKGFVLKIGERGERSFVILCLSVLNTPKLTRDEISWLETLSFYTSVSLENFIKIEELMDHLEEVKKEGSNPAWLKNLMFAIEEKQRSHLARDLHDSVLQDLISLKRQCEVLLDGNKEDRDRVNNQIQNIDEKMTAVIQTTRETLQELRPQLLYDLGLVKGLKKLISQYKESTSIDVRLNSERFNASLDLDSQLNIYRIIQELLTNTAKHSQATNVLIMLVCIKDKIVLHYEDNGVGYDKKNLNAQESGSMGLSGIQERVRALNGDLQIETDVGRGFKAVMNLYL